jgi:hypothetical protein
MANSSTRIISELAERISERRRIYNAALEADMKRLRQQHGDSAIEEALQKLERNAHGNAGTWDAGGHRAEVTRAIDRLLVGKAEDPDSFDDATRI